jgi:hypothetical protein
MSGHFAADLLPCFDDALEKVFAPRVNGDQALQRDRL